MGVFTRPDSPYYWLYLERKGKPGIKERTTIRIDPSNKSLVDRLYLDRLRELSETHYFAPRRLTKPRLDTSGWCYHYFISDGEFIKIGRAVDVQKRLRAMQTGHPKPLNVLATIAGHVHMEKLLHRRFRRHLAGSRRLWGEWFTPDPDLLDFIERARSGKDVYSELINHSQTVPGVLAKP